MSMFRMSNRFFVLFFACFFLLISACSDSDSSSSSVDPEDEKHPAKEIDVDNKISSAIVSRDTFYDSRIGAYLTTIKFGGFVWMEENATENTSNSMCYKDEPENCYTYGCLYLPDYPRCPSGFSVPTKEDWSKTMDYLDEYSEIDSIFSFPKGGYCFGGLRSNKTSCSDIGKMGYYLAGDSTVAKVKGSSVSFMAANKESYYQLRCIKYTYIVPTLDDLPECDSTSQQRLRLFYVMSEKSNYNCVDSRWVDDFSDDCSHVDEGTYDIYNDSMYICKYNEWQLADISDSKDKCTKKNANTTYLFNGELYACEDESWRPLNALELVLGYCRPSMKGNIDSIETSNIPSNLSQNQVKSYNSYTFYTCTAGGWRISELSDFMGKCDSTSLYKEDSLHGVQYVCRNNIWDTYTKLESDIGVCSPKRQGVIDTTENNQEMICDKNTWRTATKQDYLGDCVAKIENKILSYGDDKYVCRDSAWEKISNVEAKLGLCKAGIQGKIDSLGHEAYTCDNLSWRKVWPEDIGGQCNSSNQNKVVDANGDKYYCKNTEWKRMSDLEMRSGLCTPQNVGKKDSANMSTFYYCDGSEWTEIKHIEYTLGFCTASLENEIKRNGERAYKCHNESWELLSTEEALPKCGSTLWGKEERYDGKLYVCKFDRWVEPSTIDKSGEYCTGNKLGKLITVGGIQYVCTENDWAMNAGPASFGECKYKDSTVYRGTSDGTYYACHDYKWKLVNSITEIFGNCTRDRLDTQVVFKNRKYACDSTASGFGWYQYSTLDSIRGICNPRRIGDTLTYNNTLYMCKDSLSKKTSWSKVGYIEFMGTCTAAREGHKMFNGLNYSQCTNGKWVGVFSETITDSRDGNKYRIQKINGVTWMVDNLNYATADSSDCINGSSSCGTSGRLYGYSVAQKACPSGWTLPDTAQWNGMRRYVNSLDSAYVKRVGGDVLWKATENVYGLVIAPTGYEFYFLQNGRDPMTLRSGNNGSDDMAGFWSTNSLYQVWGIISYTGAGMGPGQLYNPEVTKLAVRCVKVE